MSADDSQSEQGSSEVQVDLAGVAEEWEVVREVRAQLAATGSVLFPDPGKAEPSETVTGVAANHMVLMPVFKRLYTNGQVGMVSIPQLEDQHLCF